MMLTVLSLLTATAADGRLFSSTQLSSTRINCIIQDQQGYIWIGTEYGLNKFDGYHFTAYLNRADDARSLSHNNVQALFVDSRGRLWVGTGKGLSRYDVASDDFQRFDLRPNSDDEPCVTQMTEDSRGSVLVGTAGFGLFEITLEADTAAKTSRYSANDLDDYYTAIFYDAQGRFWKVDNVGIVSCFSASHQQPILLKRHHSAVGQVFSLLQRKTGQVLIVGRSGTIEFGRDDLLPATIPSPDISLHAALLDASDQLLLGTSGHGLYRYNPQTRHQEVVDVSNRQIDFTSANVNAVYEDRQHNLWVGCHQRGLFFIGTKRQAFDSWSLTAQNVKTGSIVSSVAEGLSGSFWACLQDGGLYQFSSDGQIRQSAPAPAGQHFVYRDHQGQYWLGAGSSLYQFDAQTGTSRLAHTFSAEYLQCMADDGRGTLFVSTFSRGLSVFTPKTHAEQRFSMYQTQAPRGFLCNDWVLALHYDRQGLLWAATASGTSCYDPVRDTFRTFGWHNLLEGYTCLSLDEDPEGNILIGTDRGLFRFRKHENTVEPFPANGGLNDKVIQNVLCLADGDVWCSTAMGIWHYRHADSTLVHHINDGGLREREYTQGVGLVATDGRILFGCSDGLVSFHPSLNISSINYKPSTINHKPSTINYKPSTINHHPAPSLTRMLIGSQVVSPRSELSYLDNTFTLEFSNFDYASAANTQLEYRLNNDQWSQAAVGDNAISFNHLAPGLYRLSVRTRESGTVSTVGTYTFRIRPPWYRSTLARFAWLLLLLGAAGYAGWAYYRRKRQQLAEEKMQFLINATHDIRTPLTLILSPLHQLMKQKHDADTAARLAIIDHNARRILALVNQILDIRKIDKQQMHLHLEPTRLVPFARNIYKVFEAHAHERGITFRFTHDADVSASIDPVQFDKVVQNLLSNAFKFTPDGGEIVMHLGRQGDEHFCLSVTDTGTGISEADLPRIFHRFYQSASNRAVGKEGTGIGLNLCKMIVEMHHGTITAANRTDGQPGSVFEVVMPIGAVEAEVANPVPEQESAPIPTVNLIPEHNISSINYKPSTINHQPSSINYKPSTINHQPSTSPPKPGPGRTGYRILLVDDDAEITDYIASELSDYYHFGICHNGKSALNCLLAGDQQYDLVVTDIMMPEMDGFTLLRAIKSNLSIAHLPVILLTTEAAVGNRLKGLQRGADAFMPKPFIVEELRMQIDNLLSKSQRLKQKFSGAIDEHKEKVDQRDVADTDQQLMNRIVQSVNKNLSDGDFTVEQLATEVGLSRAQLHRRMKELTGLSASDFIRNIRLEQAARLLRERKAGISQVAYTVGFNTPSTFSKVFRQHFGQSPTEYAAREQ